jgi:hypothetical protein
VCVCVIMALFGKAISILRQLEVVLTEQLSVDLRVLRMDTDAGGTGSTTDSGNLTPSARARWLEVLVAVAPATVTFGREMNRVDAYVKQRLRSIVFMAAMLYMVELAALFGCFMVVCNTLTTARGDVARLAVSVSVTAIFASALLALFATCKANLNEMHRTLQFQHSLPVFHELDRFRSKLARAFVVRLVASVASGHDLPTALIDAFADVDNRFSDCSNDVQSCEVSGIDACQLPAITMATLPDYLNKQCTGNLLSVLDMLIELKELGVDRYDQGALWRGVQAGVDAVGSLVLVEFDDDDPAKDALTPDAVAAVVAREVAPILCLTCVELKAAFRLGPDAGRVLPQTPIADEGSLDPAQAEGACYRSCRDAADCAVGYVSASGACYSASSYDALTAFQYGSSGGGGGGGGGSDDARRLQSLFLTNPAVRNKKQNKCGKNGKDGAVQLCGVGGCGGGGGSGSGQIDLSSLFDRPEGPEAAEAAEAAEGDPSPEVTRCVSITPAELYSAALRAGAAATTMQDQVDDLSARVFHVLKRYAGLDLRERQTRAALDAALAAYYGDAVYADGVSAAVDAVLKRAARLAQDARRSAGGAPELYVEPYRLAGRLAAMTSDDAAQTQEALTQLQHAAVSHRDLYPSYRATAAVATSGAVAGLLSFVLLLCFSVFVFLSCHMYLHALGLSRSDLVQRVLVALCVLLITCTVVDLMASTRVARIQHNQDAVDNNGEMLVAAAINVAADFAVSLKTQQQQKQQQQQQQQQATASDAAVSAVVTAKCAALVGDGKALLTKYAACNSITSGQASMPFPLSDFVLYGTVAAFFIVFAAIIFLQLSPSKRIDNIRSLLDLRTRLLRGDAAAFAEARHAIQCAKPSADIWRIFVWLAIVCFVAFTMWVVMTGVTSEDAYVSALVAEEDCV